MIGLGRGGEYLLYYQIIKVVLIMVMFLFTSVIIIFIINH